jgi:hypothetical protein
MSNLFLAHVRINNGFILTNKVHLVEAENKDEASDKVYKYYEKKSDESKRNWKIISLEIEPSIK